MQTYYENPTNGYQEKVGSAGLMCFLFGPLYFLAKGIWTHAIISAVAAILTCGLSWLVYPFCARTLVEQNYLRKGWMPVEVANRQPNFSHLP